MPAQTRLLSLVIAVSGVCLNHAIATTTITFSETGLSAGYGPPFISASTPKGTRMRDQLRSYGVITDVDGVGEAWVTNNSYDSWPGHTGNYLDVVTATSCDDVAIKLSFSFVDGCGRPGYVDGSTLSVLLSDNETSPSNRVLVNTYDINGTFIEQKTLVLTPPAIEGTISSFSGSVSRIEFVDNGADGFLLDDLSFGDIRSRCLADLNCDDQVDYSDYLMFLNLYDTECEEE